MVTSPSYFVGKDYEEELGGDGVPRSTRLRVGICAAKLAWLLRMFEATA